jgi:hypothetical protein
MSQDGITQLIAVTQMKAANANDEALLATERQRRLVQREKAFLQELEANAKRTAEVLESVIRLKEYLAANPCE